MRSRSTSTSPSRTVPRILLALCLGGLLVAPIQANGSNNSVTNAVRLRHVGQLDCDRVVDMATAPQGEGDGFRLIVLATEPPGLEPYGRRLIIARWSPSDSQWGAPIEQREWAVANGKCLGVGDLDADGLADIVIGSYLGQHDLILWGGPGRAIPQEITGTESLDTNVCAVSDLDGDGCVDVYLGATHPDRIYSVHERRLVLNDPLLQRVWGGRMPSLITGSWIYQITRDVEATDIDGDGLLDLIVTRSRVQGGVSIHFGRPEGPFDLATLPVDTLWARRCRLWRRAGNAELILATQSTRAQEDMKLMATAERTLRDTSPLALTQSNDMAIGDVDGNGAVDCVVAAWTDLARARARAIGQASLGEPRATYVILGPDGLVSSCVRDDGSAILASRVELIPARDNAPALLCFGHHQGVDLYVLDVEAHEGEDGHHAPADAQAVCEAVLSTHRDLETYADTGHATVTTSLGGETVFNMRTDFTTTFSRTAGLRFDARLGLVGGTKALAYVIESEIHGGYVLIRDGDKRSAWDTLRKAMYAMSGATGSLGQPLIPAAALLLPEEIEPAMRPVRPDMSLASREDLPEVGPCYVLEGTRGPRTSVRVWVEASTLHVRRVLARTLAGGIDRLEDIRYESVRTDP